MDAHMLRALQAPLKQRYRELPDSARTGAHAEGTLDLEGVTCVVQSWRGQTTAGLHPATGGSGELACSADMLLQALVACAGVTLCAAAAVMGIPLQGGRIVADGTWDARGTLGVDSAAPVGLTDITIRFELDTSADDATLARLIGTVERYCVILQTLRTPQRVSVVGLRSDV
jgi:uncharacterized OsmC-like protein